MHCPRRETIVQQLPQFRPIDLGSAACRLRRGALLDIAQEVLVRDLHRFAIVARILEELIEEVGLFDRGQAGLGVQVERAALRAEVERAFAFEDCDGDLGRLRGLLEQAGEEGTCWAGAYDADFEDHLGGCEPERRGLSRYLKLWAERGVGSRRWIWVSLWRVLYGGGVEW